MQSPYFSLKAGKWQILLNHSGMRIKVDEGLYHINHIGKISLNYSFSAALNLEKRGEQGRTFLTTYRLRNVQSLLQTFSEGKAQTCVEFLQLIQFGMQYLNIESFPGRNDALRECNYGEPVMIKPQIKQQQRSLNNLFTEKQYSRNFCRSYTAFVQCSVLNL